MNEPAVGSPAKKRWRSPVTTSVGAGVCAEDKPDETVKDVVQTSDQEEPVQHTVNEKADGTGASERVADPIDACLDSRPDVAAQ